MKVASDFFSRVPPDLVPLIEQVSGDIDCSPQTLGHYSVDGSLYTIRPQAVIFPKTVQDIQTITHLAQEKNVPVSIRGGGTASSGGSLGEGIVLDLSRYFTHIRHINTNDQTVTVDAGLSLSVLERTLSTCNMELPPLIGEHGDATVGGLVSTKSATGSTFFTGAIREWIEGITIITDNGEEHHLRDGITPSGRLLAIYQDVFPLLSEAEPTLRASRREEADDATGYSLWHASIGPRQLIDQLVGGDGSLAVITSITFRIIPKKHHERAFIVPVTEQFLVPTVSILKHHNVEGLFLLDHTYRYLLHTENKRIFTDALVRTPYYLIVVLRSHDPHTLSLTHSSILRSLALEREHTEDISIQDAHAIMNNMRLRNALQNYTHYTHLLATIGEGVIIPKHSLTGYLMKIDKMLEESKRPYGISGYIGSNHLAVVSLFDPHSLSYKEDVLEYNKKMCDLIEHFKGGLSAVGGDGLERSAYLSYVYNSSTLNVFDRVRKIWDPRSVFGKHKKTGTTIEYLKEHIRTF